VFKAVRVGVRTDSKNLQIPWETTSLESAFMFRSPPPPPKPAKAEAVKTVAASASVPRSAVAAVNAPPAFTAGDKWVYNVTNLADGNERRFEVRVTEVRGEEVHLANGNVLDLYGNNVRQKRGNAVDTFTPPSAWYVFPLRPGNTSVVKTIQKSTYTDGRETLTDTEVTLRVVGEEEVEVPAGKIRAIRIERVARWKQRDSENGGVRTQTYWYNSAFKRMVLFEDKNVTLKGKTLVNERTALASHELK